MPRKASVKKETAKKVQTKTAKEKPIASKAVEEKPVPTNTVSSKQIIPKYKSFENRLLTSVVFFVVFATLCFLFASKTIEREKKTPIAYKDLPSVQEYKVYLKENEIYKDEYLGMNRAYVANLIDHIDIDFSYLFEFPNITNIDFNYKIMANLVIENANGTNFVDEEYVLRDTTSKELKNSGVMTFLEKVVIDYSYYNQLANNFKSETGVETNSYLNVYLQVDKKSSKDLNYSINDSSKANIKIPLSERALEINLDMSNGNGAKTVTPLGGYKFNIEYLILESIFFIITCIYLTKSIKYSTALIQTKSPYDKYVGKILRNYDRVIVETKNEMNISECNIIDVSNFEELLDVRDNLKLPILYSCIVKHEKGMFYIKNNLDVYRYIVKGIDLKNR